MNNIKGLIKEIYHLTDGEQRRRFGEYLVYLRDLSPQNTNDGAASLLGVDKKTFQRILKGHKPKPETVEKLGSVVDYFSEVTVGGVEVLSFAAWLRKHQPEIATAAKADNVATPSVEGRIEQKPRTSSYEGNKSGWSPKRTLKSSAIFLVSGCVATALIGIYAFSQYGCLLPWQCAPSSELTTQIPSLSSDVLGASENFADIKIDDLDLQFDGSWYAGSVRLEASVTSNLPDGTVVEISTDGEHYFAGGFTIANIEPTDEFLIRLTNRLWPEDLGPFDFTQQAQAAARESLELEFARNRESTIRCQPGSCEIASHTFCTGTWQKLTLGRKQGDEEIIVDFSRCDPNNIEPICLSTPQDLFPLGSGQNLFGALYSVDGGAYDFEFSSRPLTGHFQEGAPFEPLVTLTENAPPAYALYSIYSSGSEVRYSIALAAGGCRGGPTGLEDTFRAIYYDVDGKGNVLGSLRYFSIPEPEREFIAITLEGKDGMRYGPYRYAFPSEEIIESAMAPVERAISFECRRELKNRFDAKSWSYYCYAPTTEQSVFEWADVAEVHVGSSPDELSNVIQVNLSNREIVESHIQTRQGVVPPVFEYFPVKDQRDVYFSIVYKDGTATLVQRLILPAPL